MKLQPILEYVHEKISALGRENNVLVDRDFFMGFYIDDGNIIAPRKLMVPLIQLLSTVGPKVGFHIKPTKGSYLMAKSLPETNALADKEELCELLHLSPSVVHVHPDDCPASAHEYGVKILGSYLGSDEYVKRMLASHLSELSQVADNLIEYPDLQGRMLLFRKCFLMKPVHLFRTMPPLLIADFIRGFDEIKMRILCSILGCTVGELSTTHLKIINLPLAKGGLGLRDLDDVAACSFIASMLQENFRSWRNGVDLLDLPSTLFQQLKELLVSLNLDPVMVFNLDSSFKARVHLQHQLQDIVDKNRFECLENLPMDETHKTHWKNHWSEDSAAWLTCIPKIPSFKMPPMTFRSALRYRLHIPASLHQAGIRCNCKSRKLLDPFGHHLATGCCKGGRKILTHDIVKYEVGNILRYCGKHIKIEESGVFHHTNSDDNKRPDITVFYPSGGVATRLLLDVCVPQPIVGAPGSALNKAFDAKQRKYRDSIALSGFSFLPLVVESTGMLHPRFSLFLKTLASSASEIRRIPAECLHKYFIRRLVFKLAGAIASNINERYFTVNSHSEQLDIGFHPSVILG